MNCCTALGLYNRINVRGPNKSKRLFLGGVGYSRYFVNSGFKVRVGRVWSLETWNTSLARIIVITRREKRHMC